MATLRGGLAEVQVTGVHLDTHIDCCPIQALFHQLPVLQRHSITSDHCETVRYFWEGSRSRKWMLLASLSQCIVQSYTHGLEPTVEISNCCHMSGRNFSRSLSMRTGLQASVASDSICSGQSGKLAHMLFQTPNYKYYSTASSRT